MAAGITSTGYVIRTADEAKRDFEQKMRDRIDPELVLADDDPIGQMNGIMSEAFSDLWALGQAITASADPDAAEGRALDAVAAYTGTLRRAAQASNVVETVVLQPGTYAAGSLIVRTQDVTARFYNRDEIVVAGPGPATRNEVFLSERLAPVVALAGTLTVMVSSVPGWISATNTKDASFGHLADNDPTLRIRREDELGLAGGSTLDGLAADLRAIDGIASADYLENVDDVTDGAGLPPHSFEMLVYDGTPSGTNVSDELIAQTIWNGKPGGIKMFGSTTADALDSRGRTRPVLFSRPTIVNPYLEIDLEVSAADGWISLDAASAIAVKTEIVKWGAQKLRIGSELVLSQLNVPIFKVPGGVDVIEIRAGLSPSPVGTANLVAGFRELFILDSTRITINEIT